MKIISIESTCDDTSVTILNGYKVIYNEIFSQSYILKKYGGLIPNIISRNHIEYLFYFFNKILFRFKKIIKQVLIITCSGGAGMINCIITGCLYAKLLAIKKNKKFFSTNHIKSHSILIKFTSKSIARPFIMILMSGGHFLFSVILKYNNIILTRTIDDSIGDVFDKTAQMLDLIFPGGPEIEKYANYSYTKYSDNIFNKEVCGNYLSFSGTKNIIRRVIINTNNIDDKKKSSVCNFLQELLIYKILKAINIVIRIINCQKKLKNIVISGGVSSNKKIRSALKVYAIRNGYNLYILPYTLCTDNAIMSFFESCYEIRFLYGGKRS